MEGQHCLLLQPSQCNHNFLKRSFLPTLVLLACRSERKDNSAPMLRRTFMRGLVRQMGSPALLAATYSNNAEQVATAAVNELQEALVRLLGTLCAEVADLPVLVFKELASVTTAIADGAGHCLRHPRTSDTADVPLTCICCLLSLQTNCLEELLTRPAPDHQGVAGRSDWVHIYHSVLPVLSLHQVRCCHASCSNNMAGHAMTAEGMCLSTLGVLMFCGSGS